jgi:deoxyribodipyrimidine photo-lyase
MVTEAAQDLQQQLSRLGQPLVLRFGDVVEVLRSLQQQLRIEAVYSHQETGNDWTYQRDKRVKSWLRAQGIPWHEYRQQGVLRGAYDRDRWADKWEQLMGAPRVAVPSGLRRLAIEPQVLPSESVVGLAVDRCAKRPRINRRLAEATLRSFLQQRGRHYRHQMSSPVTAFQSCSRLSHHLAWGTLSLREVVHALPAPESTQDAGWRKSLESFRSRLYWHCHFMQRLESEPALEFENMQRACDGMREAEFDEARFAAWCAGETGFPLVDACLRALKEVGWINFRMRAMLVSFASYHLWLHWRRPALQLARWFVDYEPGIHYSQMQMQSGTTGINLPRIYNPVLQSKHHDPEGQFLRTWLPELASLPPHLIHEPWRASSLEQQRYGVQLNKNYPAPIVEHEAAARQAKQRLSAMRSTPEAKAQRVELLERLGSRRRPPKRRPRPAVEDPRQLKLALTSPLGEVGRD